MGAKTFNRALLALAAVSTLVGCAPNWDRLEDAQKRELEVIREYHSLVKTVVERPSGNAGSRAWDLYEVRMAAFQGDMNELMPNTYGQTLNYVSRYEDRQLQWASLGSDWLRFGISEWRKAAQGYGSKIELNANRVVKGGSSGDGSTSASGDSSFSDIYFVNGRSAGAWDSNRLAQGKDAQYQAGDGVQGQAFTDPPNFQQTEGEIALDTSFGAEAGF